jgi:hypothetical protein
LTDTTTGGDHTATVEGGKTYKIMTNAVAGWVFGIAAITSAANILWFCPPSSTVVITVPQGYTSLHYEALVNSATCYMVEMAVNLGD